MNISVWYSFDEKQSQIKMFVEFGSIVCLLACFSHMWRYGVCKMLNKPIEYGFCEFHVSLISKCWFFSLEFCFRCLILNRFWFIDRNINEEKKTKPHIDIQKANKCFLFKNKEVTNSTGNVECAICTMFICETLKSFAFKWGHLCHSPNETH